MHNLKHTYSSVFLFSLVSATATLYGAQETQGFKFNNLTVSPFVNLEAAYDSNVNFSRFKNAGGAPVQKEMPDTLLTVNPGVDLNYTGNEWGLVGNAWWAYDNYVDNGDLSSDRYGETLQIYREAAKRWRFGLKQAYTLSSQNDSILDGGQGLLRESETFSLSGDAAFEMSERTKLSLVGTYTDLSYANTAALAPLYGWQEYTLKLELATKLTEKSDVLVSGSYSEFVQDMAVGGGSGQMSAYGLMAGFGSRASQRVRYRAVTGATLYEYESGDQVVGWTYNLSANWVINKKVAVSAAGSSYFQPSRSGQDSRADQISSLTTGLTYRPMKKFTTRFDVAARREEEQVTGAALSTGCTDLYSARARLEYELMRYASIYSGAEYETLMSDSANSDYDRYRFTVGLKLKY